jgi:hypothetical protein
MALSDGTKFGSGGGWTGTWLGNGNAANGGVWSLHSMSRHDMGIFNGDGKNGFVV